MKVVLLIIALLTIVSTQGYDPELAKNFLYYAKASYCKKKTITSWDCAACPYNKNTVDVKVETSLVHGVQALVAYNSDLKLIIVAFRGSQNIQNWVDNLDYKKTDYSACSGCEIHKGFGKSWDSVQKGVIKKVNALQKKYGTNNVAVTGHSLGGALAELAALSLLQDGLHISYLYTFGTPRVGNEEFAQYAHSVIPDAMRVVHYKDPVPHVPLKSMGFLQVPTEVWYDSKTDASTYEVCTMPGVEEDPSCSDSVLDTNIKDHLEYLGISTQCNAGNEQDIFTNQDKLQMYLTNARLNNMFEGEYQNLEQVE